MARIEGEAELGQGGHPDAGDVARTVLVADDADHPDLAEQRGALPVACDSQELEAVVVLDEQGGSDSPFDGEV